MKEGDIVVTKLDSRKMIITSTNLVACRWFNETTGQYYNDFFPASALKEIGQTGTLLELRKEDSE